MKTEERKKAETLRRAGWSYNRIAAKLGVSKSSLSLWLREIELTHDQQETLAASCRIASIKSGRETRTRWEAKRKKFLDSYEPPLHDPRFMLGLGLYWGEGSKSSKSDFRISNSDPAVAKTFMRWATDFFDAKDFSARVIHYSPEADAIVKQWWSLQIDLPLHRFRKSSFKASRTSLRKRNTLEHGTIHVAAVGGGSWMSKLMYDKAVELLST